MSKHLWIFVVFCLYRLFAVFTIDLPGALNCDLQSFQCKGSQNPICSVSCEFRKAFKMDLNDYFKVDPVFSRFDTRSQIAFGLFAFIVTPSLILVTWGLHKSKRWAPTGSLILGTIIATILLPIGLEFLLTSSNPSLVLLYNVIDIVFIPFALLRKGLQSFHLKTF